MFSEADFRAAMSDLPAVPKNDRSFWAGKRRDLRRAAKNEDPAAFLRWASVYSTMFIGSGSPVTHCEIRQFVQSEGWFERWAGAVWEHPFGNPELMPGFHSSGNLLHQAYHWWLWETKSGRRLDDLEWIVEIGGGYGSLCRLAYRVGFRGRYTLYDLPEYSLLQRYYLSNVDIPIDQIEFYPSRPLADLSKPADLLVSICSLSEMEPEDRMNTLNAFPTRSYFFRYQADFLGVDNLAWFANWRKEHELSALVWCDSCDTNHYYSLVPNGLQNP